NQGVFPAPKRSFHRLRLHLARQAPCPCISVRNALYHTARPTPGQRVQTPQQPPAPAPSTACSRVSCRSPAPWIYSSGRLPCDTRFHSFACEYSLSLSIDIFPLSKQSITESGVMFMMRASDERATAASCAGHLGMDAALVSGAA